MVSLSIIIPVYNAARFLERMVGGIAFDDCEIILVDDGSTDGSDTLCDRLALADPRVVVVRQPNQGPSAARNAGLARARAPRLCFFDADDCIAPGFASAVETALADTAADLTVFAFDVDEDGRRERVGVGSRIYQRRDFGEYLAREVVGKRYGNGFLWNKVYRTDLAREVGFAPELRMMEDEIFNQEYLRLCRSVECRDTAFYTYNISGGTNSRGRFIARYYDAVDKVYGNFLALAAKFPVRDGALQARFGRDLNARTARGLFHALSFHLFHPESTLSAAGRRDMLARISSSESFKAIASDGATYPELRLYISQARRNNLTSLKFLTSIFSLLRKIKASMR